MIASVQVPNDDAQLDTSHYDSEKAGTYADMFVAECNATLCKIVCTNYPWGITIIVMETCK